MANIIAQWLDPNNFALLRDKFNNVVIALSGGATGQIMRKYGNGNGETIWVDLFDSFPVGYLLANQLMINPPTSNYIKLDGKTVGNASSTADYADSLNEEVFTFIYNNLNQTYAPVSGGRTTDAAADFAANKKITLPDMRGRSFIDGDARTVDPSNGIWDENYQYLGYAAGAKAHTLAKDEAAVPPLYVPMKGGADDLNFNVTDFASQADVGGAIANTTVNKVAGSDIVAPEAHETRHPFLIVNSFLKYR
jgi:hypothetical protein